MPREVSEGDETGWETASSVPSISTSSQLTTNTQQPLNEKKSKRRESRRILYGPPINPLEQYWDERARLIHHLEKRFITFQKRSRQDYDRARNPPLRRVPVQNRAAPRPPAPRRKDESPAVEQKGQQHQQQQNKDMSASVVGTVKAGMRRGGAAAVVGLSPQAGMMAGRSPAKARTGKAEMRMEGNKPKVKREAKGALRGAA